MVWWLRLLMKAVQIQPMVGELRSHMPHDMAKKFKVFILSSLASDVQKDDLTLPYMANVVTDRRIPREESLLDYSGGLKMQSQGLL